MNTGESTFSIAEEIRCDFFVDEKRKKIWNIQIGIAKEIRRICEKYSIKYFIIWGTLLGAVRHEGYIPWDDDFDIGFLREDYNKFCKVALKEIKSPLFFQNAYTDRGYYFAYTRIRHSNTTGIILDNMPYPYNNGIYVDIYPLDSIIKNKMVRFIQYKCRDMLSDLCQRYYADIRGEKDKHYMNFVRRYISYEMLCGLNEKVCAVGNRTNHEEVGLVYHPKLVKQYHFKKKYVGDTVQLKFENTYFSAPQYYKEILTEVYGDYSKLPPKSKRGMWHMGQIILEPDIPFEKFIREQKSIDYTWR